MIYYKIYINEVSERQRKDGIKNWQLWYTHLNQNEALEAAKAHGMQKKQLIKLFTHKSTKFNCSKTSRCMVYKCLTEKPIEYRSLKAQRSEMIQKLTA